MARETDLFYAQRFSDEFGWNSGSQHGDLKSATGAVRGTYRASELKRIVRYVHSSAVGLPSHLLIVWQGKRVPDWLGEVTKDNT